MMLHTVSSAYTKDIYKNLQLHFKLHYGDLYSVPLGHRWPSQSLHTPGPDLGKTETKNITCSDK